MKLFNRGYTYGHLFDQRGKDLMNSYRPNHLGIVLGKVIDYKDDWFSIKLENDLNQNDGIRVISKEDYGFNVNWMKHNGKLVNSALKGEIVEIKTRYKLNKNDQVLLTTDSKLIKELDDKINASNRYQKVDLDVIGKKGHPLKLVGKINNQEYMIEAKENLEASITSKFDQNKFLNKLNRTLDTPYIFNQINLDIDDDVFIPVSLINNLRRDLLSLIESELIRSSYQHIVKDSIEVYTQPDITNNIYVTITNEAQYQTIKDLNIQILTDNYPLYLKYKDHLGYSLSRYNHHLNLDHPNLTMINEPGQLNIEAKYKLTSIYFNTSNHHAINMLHKYMVGGITLSRELNDNQIIDLIDKYHKEFNAMPNLIYQIYGYRELMLTKYCLPNTYLTLDQKAKCGLCKRHNYKLKAESKVYPLAFDDDCFMHILESKPFNRLADIEELKKMGITNFHLRFYNESPNTILHILKSII